MVYVVIVAEETALSLALTETPKTGILATRPTYVVRSNLRSSPCMSKEFISVSVSSSKG